jgi:hypothetical protein
MMMTIIIVENINTLFKKNYTINIYLFYLLSIFIYKFLQ